MVWSSLAEFLDMGGYALYVWGSVLVTFGFMVTELVMLRLRRRAIVQNLRVIHTAGDVVLDDLDSYQDDRADR